MTDFEIFGIVNMGNRSSDDDRETEEVAQLQFSISEKKSELKSSESSVSCGRTQRLSHDTKLGRGCCPYDPELTKTEKGKLKR